MAAKPAREIPAPDDPRYRRTCNQCGHVRYWVVAYCPRCRCPEFSIGGAEPGGEKES